MFEALMLVFWYLSCFSVGIIIGAYGFKSKQSFFSVIFVFGLPLFILIKNMVF